MRRSPPRPAPAEGILNAIGGTPLVALRRFCDRDDVEVFAKIEASNPAGSAKDRSASRMIEDAIDDGAIGHGTVVIESTSGNLGVGLAQACRFHGLDLICVVDKRTHAANLRTMRALGADVRVVTDPDPDTGDLLAARLALVQQLIAETPNAYWPNQYANPSNPAAHADGTMREIDEAMDGRIDWLFVATSTTGTLSGCCDYLVKAGRTDTRIVAVDAEGSALFGGIRHERRLPGFGAGVEGELARRAWCDELVRVDDAQCVIGCRRLVEREAVFAGASSGGVASAFTTLAPTMEPGSRCALVLSDGGAGYLDTVYDDRWVEREIGLAPPEMAAEVTVGGRATEAT